jgi:hypothetical protein
LLDGLSAAHFSAAGNIIIAKAGLTADMGLTTVCGRIKIAESKLRWLAREDAYFNKFKLSCAEVQ